MQFNTRIDEITDPILQEKGVRLFIKRDDLIHPYVSGNKLYKLKYNVEDAIDKGYDTILTLGGAYSNHLVATAAYCKEARLKCIGIVRGSPLPNPPPIGEGTYAYKNLSPPLLYCQDQGMQLHFVSREDYRKKEEPHFIAGLEKRFGRFYLVPEGGANALGMKGAAEILSRIDTAIYTHIAVASGTGTTLAGMINSPVFTSSPQPPSPKRDGGETPLSFRRGVRGEVLGISVLKGEDTLTPTVKKYLENKDVLPNWRVVTGYHHGGYAKSTPELLDFMERFKQLHGITLDHVYTGKLFFALYQMVQSGEIPPQSNILAIHTGGISFL